MMLPDAIESLHPLLAFTQHSTLRENWTWSNMQARVPKTCVTLSSCYCAHDNVTWTSDTNVWHFHCGLVRSLPLNNFNQGIQAGHWHSCQLRVCVRARVPDIKGLILGLWRGSVKLAKGKAEKKEDKDNEEAKKKIKGFFKNQEAEDEDKEKV